jgi:hypothetical protein
MMRIFPPNSCYYLASGGGSKLTLNEMVTQAIWWAAICLEAVLFIRGLRAKLVFRYPVFYLYIVFVLFDDLLRFYIYRWHPAIYPQTFWITDFFGLVIGSGVLFEIYRSGLSAYPGTARMARNLLLLVFTVAFAKVLVSMSYGSLWWPAETTAELERNLRIVQASALIALVALFLLYAIPCGRNLKGILSGYSLYVAVSLVQLTLVSHFGNSIQRLWSYVNAMSYLIALCIWTRALWSHEMSTETSPGSPLEYDYEALTAATHLRLQETRARLGRAVRP